MILEIVYRTAESWMRSQGFFREERCGVSVTRGGYGPPFVLLHGALSHGATTWMRAAGRLARHFHVIVPDLPGFGRSRAALAPEQATVRRIARCLLAALPEWTDGRPFALAGVSLGGWVAARMALAEPGAVGPLFLVDAAGYWDDEDEARTLAPLITPEDPDTLNTLYRRVSGRNVTVPVWAARDIVRTYSRQYPALRNLIRSAETDVLTDAELGSMLRRVGVIWGDRDGLIPPDVGRALAAAIPGATLDLLPCAHTPPIEVPDRFAAAILKD